MKKLTKLLLVCFLVCVAHSNANAKAYFNQTVIAPDIIDPPLRIGSKEWNNDIKIIIYLQKHRDKKEVEKAASERDLTPEMVAEAVDPKLTRKDYPLLYKLLDNASDTSQVICDNTKDYWKTDRPYLMDRRIKALIPAHTNNSYPSGHTTGSYVDAYILGLLIPEKRQEFYARASQIANHRILVGMHYPHDIKGGKQLSLLITGAMLSNSNFQKDFAKAQREFLGEEKFKLVGKTPLIPSDKYNKTQK